MKQTTLSILFLFFFYISGFSQNITVKSNFSYWATSTPNIGMEFSLSKKKTLEISGGFNPFSFGSNKKFKHWLLQPELRYWFCESFNGHFVGLHAHGAQFNVGGWDIPIGKLDTFANKRYQGNLYGGGLSYGYQWLVSPRWNIELSLGGGYARINYDKFPCETCGTKIDKGEYNYWGVTKTALALIYFIN